MNEKKFAFEFANVSIAFPLIGGLGDCVIAKKIFDALIELEPDCRVDLFCISENHKHIAAAFFGRSKNLNLILEYTNLYQEAVKFYDLALFLFGSRAVILEQVNEQNLQKKSPALFRCVEKLREYNQKNFYEIGSPSAVALRNNVAARILGKNCYYFLSSGGAFPVHDDKVNLPLAPEYQSEFDALNLGRYITIYTDIDKRKKDRPKAKTWPVRHIREFVSLMKKNLPDVEVVQCGAWVDVVIENADRHFLDCDLELTKYILANSMLHVGCEGGLIHLATALNTKCLVLFGYTDVNFYGYARNMNIVSDVCQSCSDVWGDANFNVCMRGNEEPPCMLNHTPQKVFELTYNYLKHFEKNNA